MVQEKWILGRCTAYTMYTHCLIRQWKTILRYHNHNYQLSRINYENPIRAGLDTKLCLLFPSPHWSPQPVLDFSVYDVGPAWFHVVKKREEGEKMKVGRKENHESKDWTCFHSSIQPVFIEYQLCIRLCAVLSIKTIVMNM